MARGDLIGQGRLGSVPDVAIDADTVALAVAETWQHLLAAVPGGWGVRDGGAIAVVTGVPLAALNGVWPERADPELRVVAALLDRVAATGLPHCLQARPGTGTAIAELAAIRGMHRDQEDVPLMVMEDPARLPQARHVAGLEVRQLHPDEAQLHASVAAAGFEAPEGLFLQLVTPDVLRLPGVRCYVGEVSGHPVTTGIGVTLGAFVGIFNVATPPADRRRGYGAAVTARAASDGLAAGAAWSWLQSSASGYPVYERLGFRAVESWHCWLSPD